MIKHNNILIRLTFHSVLSIGLNKKAFLVVVISFTRQQLVYRKIRSLLTKDANCLQ